MHFVSTALQALRTAEQIVTRGLPFVLSMEPLATDAEWVAEHIFKVGPYRDEVLDGPSYGLSILLAAASLVMNVPVPADLAASAAVREDGTLDPVGELERKVGFLVESAPGIRRLLVHSSQADAARAVVSKLGGGLEVIGVGSTKAACSVAFADAHEQLARSWTAEEVRAIAWKLYLLALERRSPILDWRAVVGGAELLLRRLEPEQPERELVNAARQIARRALGELAPLPWPEREFLARLSRPLRDRHLAHVIQAASDAGLPELPDWLGRDLVRLPPPRECYGPQLALWGAIGRALASLRRYAEARDCLWRIADAWRENDELQQAAHVIAELIRIHGILRDAAGLSQSGGLVAQLLQCPHLSLESRAYLHLALGRANLQVGDAQAALRWLGESLEIAWATVRDRLRRRRLRWWANTLVALGQAQQAAQLREQLLQEGEEGSESLLARLDQQLERGGETAPLVQRVLALPEGPIASRLLEGLEEGSHAERLAREFPY